VLPDPQKTTENEFRPPGRPAEWFTEWNWLKAQDRIKAITTYVESAKRQNPRLRKLPRQILDLIVFHKLHFFMPEGEARSVLPKAEVDLRSTGTRSASARSWRSRSLQRLADSLELSIFVKDILEQLHRENQSLDLEFLAEKSMMDIRRFLRSIRGVEPATID